MKSIAGYALVVAVVTIGRAQAAQTLASSAGGDRVVAASEDTADRRSPGYAGRDSASRAEASTDRPINYGLPIHSVQGKGQISPYAGRKVADVPGIVTAVSDSGFVMQDPDADHDPATSEAIAVYTGRPPKLADGRRPRIGDAVRATGRVVEYVAGDAKKNLPVTEISVRNGRGIARIAKPGAVFSGLVIKPVVLGVGGRPMPTEIIENNARGHFDPARNGLDFYESLEFMQVRVNQAHVVGPPHGSAAFYVVADRGKHATGMNPRGGITLRDHGDYVDYNPERLEIDGARLEDQAALPKVNVGAVFDHISGTLEYDAGHYVLEPRLLGRPAPSRLAPNRLAAVDDADHLAVATYNVENLDPNDDDGNRDIADGQFAALGAQIAQRLHAPAIIALQEIQDNDGTTPNHGVNPADKTLRTLVDAIEKAGGPHYAYTEIAPIAGTNGGEPGGNIRTAYLYDAARVSLVDVGKKGNATTAVKVGRDRQGRLTLSANPGLVEPNAKAFSHSRKPLAALFAVHGRRLLLINNHFTSKGGSTPLYGATQPPINGNVAKRIAQGDIVNAFVDKALAAVPQARIAALGDFNEFAFNAPLRHLVGIADGHIVMHDLLDRLPPLDRYTYVYQGNSQALDHVFASDALYRAATAVDVAHINAEYAHQTSDHDPVRVVFRWP